MANASGRPGLGDRESIAAAIRFVPGGSSRCAGVVNGHQCSISGGEGRSRRTVTGLGVARTVVEVGVAWAVVDGGGEGE